MRRLTAAVLMIAAVATTLAGIAVSAAVDAPVRAEVVVAGKGHPLDVRRIRIVDGLRSGESYRLPAFRIRNHSGHRTAYRLVVIADIPRRWLRLVPSAVVIDPGQSRAVSVVLELPADAESGAYAVDLRVRPGDSEAARLTFRIRGESTAGWLRQAANLALGVVLALAAALVAISFVRAMHQVARRKRAANV